MAEWQRNSLADTGAFKQLAEQGEAAITTVQSVLQLVQGGAEVAKIFLTGIANPAAIAAAALADALAASLNNYKESGYFLLIIDPTNDNYGVKLNSPFGLFAFKNLTSELSVLLELINKNSSDFDFEIPTLKDSSFSSYTNASFFGSDSSLCLKILFTLSVVRSFLE